MRVEPGGVGRRPPSLVAAGRVLDLDHVRAEPGERLGAGRSRLELREIEHPHARRAPSNRFVPFGCSSLPRGVAGPTARLRPECSRAQVLPKECRALHGTRAPARAGVRPAAGRPRLPNRRGSLSVPPAVQHPGQGRPVVHHERGVAAGRERRFATLRLGRARGPSSGRAHREVVAEHDTSKAGARAGARRGSTSRENVTSACRDPRPETARGSVITPLETRGARAANGARSAARRSASETPVLDRIDVGVAARRAVPWEVLADAREPRPPRPPEPAPGEVRHRLRLRVERPLPDRLLVARAEIDDRGKVEVEPDAAQARTPRRVRTASARDRPRTRSRS